MLVVHSLGVVIMNFLFLIVLPGADMPTGALQHPGHSIYGIFTNIWVIWVRYTWSNIHHTNVVSGYKLLSVTNW